MYGRDLRQLFDGRGVVGLTEAQLVDRIARRDESAEAILRRHGPPTPRDRVRRGDLAAAPGLPAFMAESNRNLMPSGPSRLLNPRIRPNTSV